MTPRKAAGKPATKPAARKATKPAARKATKPAAKKTAPRRKASPARKPAASQPLVAQLQTKLRARLGGRKRPAPSFELLSQKKGDIRVDHAGNGLAWLLNDAHDMLIALSVTWMGEEAPDGIREWCREAAEDIAGVWRPRDWEPIDSDWDEKERCFTLVLHRAASDLDQVADELIWAAAQRRDVSIEPISE